MGLGIAVLAILFAIISVAVLVAVTNIGQARWQRREFDAQAR